MKTALVLDALEQALWTRRRDGARDLGGLVHHTVQRDGQRGPAERLDVAVRRANRDRKLMGELVRGHPPAGLY